MSATLRTTTLPSARLKAENPTTADGLFFRVVAESRGPKFLHKCCFMATSAGNLHFFDNYDLPRVNVIETQRAFHTKPLRFT